MYVFAYVEVHSFQIKEKLLTFKFRRSNHNIEVRMEDLSHVLYIILINLKTAEKVFQKPGEFMNLKGFFWLNTTIIHEVTWRNVYVILLIIAV